MEYAAEKAAEIKYLGKMNQDTTKEKESRAIVIRADIKFSRGLPCCHIPHLKMWVEHNTRPSLKTKIFTWVKQSTEYPNSKPFGTLKAKNRTFN